MNPLPDRSNYSPLCHTHYLTPDQYFTSLFRADPLPSHKLETKLQKFNAAALYCRISSRELSALRKLNNKQRQVSMFLILLFKLLTQLPFVSFLLSLLPFSILLFSSPPSLLSLLTNSLSPKIAKDLKFHYILFHGTFFCILFHTMTFLIMHSISLQKPNFYAEDLKKQWLHRRFGSRNSNKGGGLSGPPSLQIVFLSLSLSPLCTLSQSSLFSLSSFPLASVPSLLAL